MWKKNRPIDISPELNENLNRVRHNNDADKNYTNKWLENGRVNDEAFNTSEKEYLEELKTRMPK